jgi:hypothetical protein
MLRIRTRLTVLGVCLTLVFTLGCQGSQKSLQFIIPNGFSGPFVIVERQDGLVLKSEQPTAVIHVPNSGLVLLTSFDELRLWRHHSASFAGGPPIGVYEVRDNEIALRGGGLVARNGRERIEYFVGTLQEFQEFSFDDWEPKQPQY